MLAVCWICFQVIFLRVSVLAKLSTVNSLEEYFFSFGVFKRDGPFLLFNSSKSVYSNTETATVFIDDKIHFHLSQIGFKNMQNVEHVPLTLEKALQLVKDVFISAAERDVYTGDALKICIVTKDGIKEQTVQLRKD